MPDLNQLSEDLDPVDRLIMDIIKRRMDIAQLVVSEKIRN